MVDDTRPDPDELLSRLNEERADEQQSTRGRLKIFFGACAGVGKTYAMLNAARQALKEGVHVVIGLVETHGREETKQLAEGIPTLPRKIIQYRGAELSEFDIDGALALAPQLVVLDELAHTNVPGSRHPKRWQDVEELLNAGISVYTTVNVQHLESLNDVVARITGIWVKETVPDAFFDSADEISLIDIPSEELLKRLKEGKVYIAPGAKRRAAQNFFRKSNLIALRELALRRTAERVDAQMDKYKSSTGATQAWSGADKILVCIGPDALSAKLVRVAKRTAGSLRATWTAIYVENERHYRLSPEGQDAVERTLRLAERMGGDTETVQGSDAVSEIMTYAREHGVTKIIVGKKPRPRWKEVMRGTLADNIIRVSKEIDVYVVTGDEEKKPTSTWRLHDSPAKLLAAPLAAAVATAMIVPLRDVVEPSSLLALYLIAIVLMAVRYGRSAALVTTALCALAFNFFHLEPYLEFKMANPEHVIAFGILLLSGVLVGAQTSKLRLQAIYARKRERSIANLYAMTRELTASRGKKNLSEIAARHIGHMMDADVSIWLPDAQANLACVLSDYDGADVDRVREESAARYAFSHKTPAGLETETLPGARGYYAPLLAAGGTVGVIGIVPDDALPGNAVDTMETIASIVASAVERANAAELVERTLVETESEKLRNILLSSVSHDLRMPLAAITSATSTLLNPHAKLTEEYRFELLRLIHEEAARLARMVTNLLDVTSLQTGSVKLNKELYFIEELIGSALMRIEHRLGNRRIETAIEQSLPLVRMDGLLIEQVLINLFENVIDHTPDGTQVTVRVELHKPDLHVTVEDNGLGVPAGDEERIFDRFYSAHTQSISRDAKEGALGLAICRGIIKAHGGKIWAQNCNGGGAIFTFTLPVKSSEG